MKRVNLFCGHYGSGKSNIAVNYAMHLKTGGLAVALCDIDIVNPYFRSADSADELKAAGVEVITLPFANSNVDLPAIPSQVYGLVERRDIYAVMDIGGDDRGALALGRFAPYILKENDYDMFFVVNFYRPLTSTPGEALDVLREIEAASAGLKFTKIINNSNLGDQTRAEDIENTLEKVSELSRMSGLPVAFTCYSEKTEKPDIKDAFMIKLQKKII